LQESKNTLAAVIDASPVGIVCSDLERRIALWNPAAEKLYGYTAAEAIGTAVQIVPPDGQADSFEMYKRARSGETIQLSRIKIDRGFVRKIIDDADAAAIVRSLIVMAHNLGL
jgi:PAS domain S-box-containing protein